MPRDTTFGPRTGWRNSLARLWRQWRRRRASLRLARRFSERDLRDLGLTHGDLCRQFARPFWQWDS